MRKKKAPSIEMVEFIQSDIVSSQEYEFSPKITFRPGDKLKIKRQHGIFKFFRYVVNPSRDAEWIDVIDKNGQFRAFYVSDIRGPAKIRKRRVKIV